MERIKMVEEYSEDYDEKRGDSKHIEKYVFLGILFVLFSLLFLVVFSSNDSPVEKIPTCGDGTFYGKCSLTKPYYCSNSILIKDSISCGCPSAEENNSLIFRKLEGYCESNYFNSDVEVYYSYLLDGVEAKIPFTVHSNVVDYLQTLPRHVYFKKDEVYRRDDFKLLKINVDLQREAIMPMVVAIQNAAPESRDMQAKIAISLVQMIPYAEPDFQNFGGNQIRLSRYPYEVLDDYAGSCEGKSELLVLLLRELGFGVSVFYYLTENHEAVGISCPLEHSYLGSGYCFVETTVPAPISYSEGYYLGLNGGRLRSTPEIIPIANGASLGEDIEDYEDAKKLDRIITSVEESGTINTFQQRSYNLLKEKYRLNYF